MTVKVRSSSLKLLLVLTLTALGLGTPTASASGFDPVGFHLLSSHLYVHESEGVARITVARADVSQDAQIRYIAVGVGHPCGSVGCTAWYDDDFKFVQGTLDFPPLVATRTFSVPITDHHAFTLPQTLQVALYGPSPIGMAAPQSAVLTIVNDDPPNSEGVINGALGTVVGNPVGASTSSVPAPVPNPLGGERFFVDRERPPAKQSRRWRSLRMMAAQPWVERFGTFSGPDIGMAVSHYLARTQVQSPGSVPMLATYEIVDGHCGHWADPPDRQQAYHDWVTRFAQGIGDYRGVLFMEMDSLITTPCLNAQGVAIRMHELSDAIDVLRANCPRLAIYLDAGAADAVPAPAIARLLKRAGVSKIQGFFLNSTHYDWTSREIRFGEAVSRMTGGKHFVINTSMNGRGPLRPRDVVRQGNEVLCNPPGRGLGPLPTAETGIPNVDAFAWILHPGESTGRCGKGAPRTGQFWLHYALMLMRNANLHVS